MSHSVFFSSSLSPIQGPPWSQLQTEVPRVVTRNDEYKRDNVDVATAFQPFTISASFKQIGGIGRKCLDKDQEK